MKYLCLAYGAEADWHALSKPEQDALLAQDEVLRQRGDLVAAVQPAPKTVRAWDGTPDVTEGAFAASRAPLAGFAIIEAADFEEVVRLVADTPCARAKGAIEVRPIMEIDDA
ncbi:MAG TPA: YciI family protein [Longimicrobiaceae bacterium]|nr:YciI family protein [Longimicrobiaceae bacterium]